MAEFSKQLLSASVDGGAIVVAGETYAEEPEPTLIHTAPSGTASKDEVYLYATNSDDDAVELTINFAGGAIVTTLESKSGLGLIIPGLIIQNAQTITATASTANVISLVGFVNRIS